MLFQTISEDSEGVRGRALVSDGRSYLFGCADKHLTDMYWDPLLSEEDVSQSLFWLI